jgi:hypothetical protein
MPRRHRGDCRYSSTILDLGSSWRWVISFTPRPFYSHWIGGCVGPITRLDALERRKILSLSGLELRHVGRPARRQSLCRLHYPGSWLREYIPREYILETPVLRPTQPFIQWVPGAPYPGVKRPGREANHLSATSAEVKITWIYTATPPMRHHGIVINELSTGTTLRYLNWIKMWPRMNVGSS